MYQIPDDRSTVSFDLNVTEDMTVEWVEVTIDIQQSFCVRLQSGAHLPRRYQNNAHDRKHRTRDQQLDEWRL